MIKIDKNIISDIEKFFNPFNCCYRHNGLNQLKEKIYNYFNELNGNEEINSNCFYNDFYLSNEKIEDLIYLIFSKLNNGYIGDFYLYTDEEIFYTIFNENLKKDALIIDLLERLDNPINYLLLNLFCEPSNEYWYNKLFEVSYNIMLTTEKLFYNCYTKQE